MTRSTRLALPVVALLCAVALGACGSAQRQPATAALVAGTSISDDTVAALATEVMTVLGPDGAAPEAAELNRRVISALVQERVIDVASERAGITVTESQVAELIANAAKQSGSRVELEKGLATQYGIAPSQLNGFARANLEYQGISAKLGGGDQEAGSAAASRLIGELSTELGVTVSPRFGVWAPEKLTVLPPKDDLSAPLPSQSIAPLPAFQSSGS